MANLRTQPTGNLGQVGFYRAFIPQGGNVAVAFVNTNTNELIHMFRWGDQIYVPVTEGMQLAIMVANLRNDIWVAVPGYMEGLGFYEGAPSKPEHCTPEHMWELAPYPNYNRSASMMLIKGVHNPRTQQQRPFEIGIVGGGFTISEAAFNDPTLRGRIAIYERLQRGGGYNPPRQDNAGSFRGTSRGGGLGTLGGGFTPESYGGGDLGLEGTYRGGNESFGGTAKGLSPESATRGGNADSRDLGGNEDNFRGGQAGVMLGAAQYSQSGDTGVQYQPTAQPVIKAYIELRSDLVGAVVRNLGSNIRWTSPYPNYYGWWNEGYELPYGWPYTYRYPSTGPIAPDVPLPPYRRTPHKG